MTEKQKNLLIEIKASMPPDSAYVVDTNTIRWELLIQLLETILENE
jgi:hypothetical protein